ncbi:MAG: hypothetical protein F4164_00415 [Gemmatimonadales bacterium]|nr:hypothetical protein [Gemmatimonadales bacterium]MYG47839.1 hypothetical protein [Gemmatimonadales bacterium]MYK02538.1 hypothetical protein [Candidatus Palauibacter ramosifaciens]
MGRSAHLRPVRIPSPPSLRGAFAGPAHRLGHPLPNLRIVRRPDLRGRLLPLPLGRLSFRAGRHPLRRAAGSFLHRPRRAGAVPAYPRPGQLP